MTNPSDSATPEQKFWMWRSALIAPIVTITGYTTITRKDIEAKSISVEEILKRINRIEESANKIKDLIDEMTDSIRASQD